MLLSCSNISKIQGGESLYTNVNFQIKAGEKVGLVGLNGSGKTTLFRMIIGEDKPDNGEISFAKGIRWAYFSQNVGELKGETALNVVMSGDEQISILSARLKEFEDKLCDVNISEDEMNKILSEMGDVQSEFEKRGGYDVETRAITILTGLGIQPSDHQHMIEDFSGGWKMRIALARVLVINPDLIIMDEPTNYLDLETIIWLEQWLKEFEGAIFMTTHDRFFMNNICKKIIEVAHQKVTTYSGNFDFYEKEKVVRLNQIKSEFKKQQESIAKDEDFIARFKARASHAAQVQSRVKKLEKIERVIVPSEEAQIKFEFPTPPRGGDDVVVIKDLEKSWTQKDGSQKIVFSQLNTTIKRLEKIAIVGVNGAGKSTLMKCICGQTKATAGSVVIGPSIKLGYFSQFSFENLNREDTVLEHIKNQLPDPSDGYLRNLLAAFLFRGDDVEKQIKYLSGGEKSRLILATLLSQYNNLLVLDEPTNHLDLQSREVLLKALKNFEGTVLLVSHDRYFLREFAKKIYEVDKEKITIYPGDYDYYCSKTIDN